MQAGKNAWTLQNNKGGVPREIVVSKVESCLEREEGGTVKTFGIRCSQVEKSGKNKKFESCLCLVEDVSTSESFIDMIIGKLVQYHVFPEHIRDIIEDMLDSDWGE